MALTHSSYAAEHDVESNERLEFLGDAVVDLAIADLIVTRYPQLNEGTGSLVRSRVVNEAALARAARELDLGAVLRVGRGVKKEHGAERPSLLADAFEAVVAALYFERGYDVAKSFVHDALARDVDEASLDPSDVDPKTLPAPVGRGQWARRAELRGDVRRTAPRGDLSTPPYAWANSSRRGEGRSKKSAEGEAARAAWREHADA